MNNVIVVIGAGSRLVAGSGLAVVTATAPPKPRG